MADSTLPDRALVLLSGGMDSTTLLWWLLDRGVGDVTTVSIDYGQRHRVELDAARDLSRRANIPEHRVLTLDLRQIGGSPLTADDLAVPNVEDRDQVATVVPFRNMLFVTLAAAFAETRGIHDIWISPVRDDREAYRDCRRPFYDALEAALSLGATRPSRIRVHTPFVDLWKSEIVRIGLDLGVPYDRTHTCYEGVRPACGCCDACAERLAAFAANSIPDPIPYVRSG